MLIRALGKCFEIRKAPGQLVRQVRFLPVEKEISPWAASRDVMDTVLSGFFASNTSASAAAKLLQSCPTLQRMDFVVEREIPEVNMKRRTAVCGHRDVSARQEEKYH